MSFKEGAAAAAPQTPVTEAFGDSTGFPLDETGVLVASLGISLGAMTATGTWTTTGGSAEEAFC